MPIEKHVTNREFMRNPKKYKDLMKQGKIHILFLPLDEERSLRITVDPSRRKARTGKELAALIRSLPKPIHIERPHWMWDEWMERIEKRRSERSS